MPDQTEQDVIQAHRINSIALMGTVTGTDYTEDPGKVTVKIGPADENESKITIPFLRRRGGNDWEWWAPEKDEQVLIVAPGGNLQRAVIVGSLPYTGKLDSLTPSEKGKRWVKEEAGEAGKKLHSTGHVVHYQDKTTYSYDKELHIFQATFLEGKTIDLKIDATKDKENAQFKIKEDIDIKADVTDDKPKIDITVKDIKLNIDSTSGSEKITVDVKSGKTKLEMDGQGTINITAGGGITMELKDKGNVTLNCKELSVVPSKLTVNSSGEVAITGSAIKLNC